MNHKECEKMKVVVVGAGLVGSLCACILAKRDYRVEVYESRPDPRSSKEQELSRQGRSINLALSARGRAALSRAGLENRVLSQAIPMRGRMIHSLDGSTKTILYDPNTQQCIYSVSRQFLNELLISEAAKHSNVTLHFSHKLLDSNLDKGELTFQNEKSGDTGSNVVSVIGDMVVGADGAHSTLRRAVLKRPMTNFSQFYIDHGYIELRVPAMSNGEHAMPTNYLHIWPRNEFMLIALPNLDGSFTATLFMPMRIFHELTDEKLVDAFFSSEFPDAVKLIGRDHLIKDFFLVKASHLISVKCSPHSYGKGVLIGDAAHAMVPFYGQGMNAGFEDVLLLDDALEEIELPAFSIISNGFSNHKDVKRVLREYSEKRVPNAHAICELALYNYLEMRCLVNKPGFILRRFLDYKLHLLLGKRWTPMYNNVTFSLTPYTECIQEKKRQDEFMAKAKTGVITLFTTFTLLGCFISRQLIKNKCHLY